MDRDDAAARWELVLPHREALVRVARSRGKTADDAEECAHEAMLRAVEFPALDPDRVLPFLVTTTIRLCADDGRRTVRDRRLAAKLTAWHTEQESPEDEVCGRAEAAWLAGELASLPAWQRDVLAARAEGLDGSEVARRFGVSYKTIESQLYRIRTRARGLLATTLAAMYGMSRRVVPSPKVAVVATVATAATAGLLLGGGGGRKEQPPSTTFEYVAPVADATTRAPRPRPAPTPDPARPVARQPTVPPTTAPATSPGSTPSCLADHEATGCFRPNATYGVDCVRYGVDTRQGLECKPSPSAEETG
jgi:RNA polymerase sigma factor (sigma-70 family)